MTSLTTERSLEDLIRSFELSSYRENLLEQIFCAELLQGWWQAGLPPVELDRPFVDFQGYDLVATCGSITRHMQLKATRGLVTAHRALASKPSACVINLVPRVEGTPKRILFSYRFYGQTPGTPLDLTGFKAARKTVNVRQAGGEFAKPERLNHVVIPNSRFVSLESAVDLSRRLFSRTGLGSLDAERNSFYPD